MIYLYHIVFARHEVANFKLLFSQKLGLVENYFVLRPPSVEHHVVKDSDCDDCDGDDYGNDDLTIYCSSPGPVVSDPSTCHFTNSELLC